ncbi:MAG: hypothetical protein ACREJG_12530 [Candidatus Rokuibacteriota bacterium]
MAVARFFGKTASPAAVLVSVVSHWLAAWVLWSVAGGLAVRHGWLVAYPAGVFGLLALVAGAWHYHASLRGGRERALAVFVGAQLAWLAIVLYQNGAFAP